MAMKQRIRVVVVGVLAVLGLTAQPAHAVPVLGAQIFSLGGDVEVEVLSKSAAFTHNITLYLPVPVTFIADSGDIGALVNLGSYALGDELVFGIDVVDTGNVYQVGPGSRNPDNLIHAKVEFLDPNTANVYFEDILNGGDFDYNDTVFQVRLGELAQPPPPVVPEPGSAALLLMGFAGFGVTRRTRLA